MLECDPGGQRDPDDRGMLVLGKRRGPACESAVVRTL
jgi:hypothetical protein